MYALIGSGMYICSLVSHDKALSLAFSYAMIHSTSFYLSSVLFFGALDRYVICCTNCYRMKEDNNSGGEKMDMTMMC